MGILKNIFAANAPCATVLIRLVVGGTFLSEGIQKFLFPDALGAGRFVKIGIPYPEVMAPFVGVFEIGCGALLILGLLTRLAAIPMIVNISVAILSEPRSPFSSGTASGGSTFPRPIPTDSGAWRTKPAPTSPCFWAGYSS